ncbi:hypothetical protein TNCV_4581121 [Trichonephila clavipes]|nr:hypothetical protein TNCV_4581121 [Trichonephila clavipes]
MLRTHSPAIRMKRPSKRPLSTVPPPFQKKGGLKCSCNFKPRRTVISGCKKFPTVSNKGNPSLINPRLQSFGAGENDSIRWIESECRSETRPSCSKRGARFPATERVSKDLIGK